LRFERALLAQAEAHADTLIPGYTHLQRAQPICLAHHLLAYIEMAERDRARLADLRVRVNVCPLGAAALAGTPVPIDRRQTAEELGFDSIYANSLDAVSDRDFTVEFMAAASLVMVHLSRLAEEVILWASEEFGFVVLTDRCATGSSLMPQKKNPDVPELVRGKSGRVFGHLMGLLTMIKGLPLAYNKDFQEDKEALFDVVRTTGDCLEAMAILLEEGGRLPGGPRCSLPRGLPAGGWAGENLPGRGAAAAGSAPGALAAAPFRLRGGHPRRDSAPPGGGRPPQ
jgi:argininosuccinate lyase